ncbi:hypothetical protein U9M48_034299 [Paspalum notatum var. saurae]|uniref:Dof zinc finger protein n=1 Tax=Paspalum notatum var. saurae TaxID=547442 RepID=A0AAQ3X7T6_PASNO
MAPAASASILSAAATNKRPPASDADQPEPPLLDSSSSFSVPIHHHQGGGGGDDAARSKGRQPKQLPQQQLECPRCQSTNTKFCYYNNYSTAQPRHFCRACRRYWTHGGTLRDVPVGGASRRSGKRRRVDPASSSASPPPPQPTEADACLAGALSAFPFLSDGSFLLPQFDYDFDLGVGAAAPAPFSSWQPVVPGFYDGLAPWDDGTAGAAAWGGFDLDWTPPPPPGN